MKTPNSPGQKRASQDVEGRRLMFQPSPKKSISRRSVPIKLGLKFLHKGLLSQATKFKFCKKAKAHLRTLDLNLQI